MSQAKKTVAYLGPESSYTYQAALSTFGQDNYSFLPQVSIQDVFQAVQSGTANTGVVPFENSSNGSVIYTLDLFADRQNLFPSIVVTDEAYLDIHHYLLSHAPDKDQSTSQRPLQAHNDASGTPNPLRTPPNTAATKSTPAPRAEPLCPLDHITRIYSHPQAFGQCDLFLRKYLPQASLQEVTSTSAAAALVAQDETGTSAAISSLLAAKANGLDVLAEGIEDREDNRTRFFILRRKEDEPDRQEETPSNGEVNGTERYKTLVSFTISHVLPGALADALTVFKTHRLNLTSINSRPSRLRPWHYVFFVEFEGRKWSREVDEALEELEGRALCWRWLGSWRNRLA